MQRAGIIHRTRHLLHRLAADRAGATIIEYALLVALLAMLIVGVLGDIGDKFEAILQAAADGFNRPDPG